MPVDPKLKDITVDDIIDTYKQGYLPANAKNDLLRRKAESTLAEMVDDKGYLGAVLTRTIEHVQAGWDDLKSAAIRPREEGVKDDIKAVGRAIWGQVQMLTSVFNAFGEVNGAIAEKMALGAGASPGLAKVINVAVDVGSGFVPIGTAARSAVKGVQAVGKKVAAKGAEKAASKTAEAAVKLEAQQAEQLITTAINQGLKADGMQGLEGFVLETADEGTKIIKEAMKQLTPQEAFTKSLQAFRREMEQITERKAHEITLAEAQKLGIGIEHLRTLQPGTALKESEMAAYLKALDEPVDDLVAWAKKTLAGEEGAGEAMAKKLTEFFDYSPKFRAAEVTAGRSVEILKETPPMKSITNMLMGWNAEPLAKGDFQAALRMMAEDIIGLADEPGKLKALQVGAVGAGDKGSVSFWEKMREAYINLLLARPVTQVRNFLGDSFAAIDSVAERSIGGIFTLDKKTLYDRANPLSNEGYYQAQGYFAAIGDGMKAYAQAFKSFTPEEATKLDFVPHRIGGTIGRIINVPGDSMRGMDNFFKAILTRGDIYAQAVRKGMQQGLKENQLAAYVAERANLPSMEMLEQAKNFALSGTFQNDLGVIGKRLQSLAQAGPMVLLFPFMKTPMNLAKYAWNRTPGLQLLSKSLYDDILAGGARADQAIGRLTMANMMGMFWYGLAQQGIITGGGPVDPQLKRSWLGDKMPYSIRGKDGWYQIPQLDPATTPLFLMADFAEVRNQLDEPTAEQTAMAVGLALTRDIVDKSYWQTVGDLVDLVSAAKAGEEPGKKATRIMTGPALAVTTGGPLVGSFARIADPVRREARSFVDQWRSRVPGYGKDLPPMRDGYGDPILIPQALGPDFLAVVSPFTASNLETDPIKQEGARLQVKLPMFPWSLGGKLQDDFDIRAAMPGDQLPVELTSEQRNRWQIIYRNILRHPDIGMDKTILQSEQYKNGPFALQREMFMSYLAQARNAAKDTLMIEDTELAKKVVNAKAGKYLPLMQPEQRQEVEESLSTSTDLLDTLLPAQQNNLLKWGFLESGEERDREVITGIKAEINKPISELNEAAKSQPTP